MSDRFACRSRGRPVLLQRGEGGRQRGVRVRRRGRVPPLGDGALPGDGPVAQADAAAHAHRQELVHGETAGRSVRRFRSPAP